MLYEVDWKMIAEYTAYIEADSIEEAKEKLYQGDTYNTLFMGGEPDTISIKYFREVKK